MCIENEISKFMMKVSKFEFFLINKDINLARINEGSPFSKIMGVEWEKVGKEIQTKYKFAEFEFDGYLFKVFKETSPQFLVKDNDTGEIKWDSDEVVIDSWAKLLTRSFAQLRNNIAHGNKDLIPAPFTEGRTEEFIKAGDALMNFIANEVFGQPDWQLPIEFKS